MSDISKLERILMTDVIIFLKRIMFFRFCWIIVPLSKISKDYKIFLLTLYDNYDEFDENSDYNEDSLSRLGLDTERMNNRHEYWLYNIRDRY